ncbi:CoA transferase [Pseudomonas japonica]|uniref:CoA-transferase family III n=1 Tax=Pseudomonas japonica TaxID=256466 RepID=A0A239KYY5_9PSED|nr:CoA transferase [Pseudomonas japonica]SNT23567.1 CoA-transferase family III [Pseudomonas japonica]
MLNMLGAIAHDLALPPPAAGAVRFAAAGNLPAAFAVTEMAGVSVAAAGLAIAALIEQEAGECRRVLLDRRLAALWFASSLRPQGWQTPPPWDPIAGDYQTRDGWIRLHTNAPHHRAVAEQVLGPAADRQGMARRVLAWSGEALEQSIVEAGGCAARMRSWQQWSDHPQGLAVNAEPLIRRQTFDADGSRTWSGTPERPLHGVRVLDLTRVLAGPVATRLLAGFGADVLRIDPPGWEEPGVVAEVTLGKRCARLDLRDGGQRKLFEHLLTQADILVHGYRADALERLGYGDEQRRALNPALVDISLNAYGWSGPWRLRRGFDSLVQMSTGIAHAGMRWQQASRPVPLPVQALDHATGYLMAAAAIRGLAERLATGHGGMARLSLARTAKWLVEQGTVADDLPLAGETPLDLACAREQTPWGPAQRLKVPLQVLGAPLQWERGACELGSMQPCW